MGKYIFYAGRVHHFLKMEPLRIYLENNGHEAVWLTSNNAINIDPSSEYLHKYNVKYKHVFDYCEDGDVEKWTSLYRGTLQKINFGDVIKNIPPFWYNYSLREAAQLLVLYGKAVRGVDGVFVLHTNNFFTKALAYIAQEVNIPVYAFQEGLLRDRDQETMNKQSSSADYCTKLFVWSNKAKEQYLASGVEAKLIEVVGAVHLDNFVGGDVLAKRSKLKGINGIHPQQVVVSYMLPFMAEYAGDAASDVKKLKEFCDRKGIVLILRPHPMNGGIRLDGIRMDHEDNALPLIMMSDLVLGQHSTIMAEAPALGTMFAEYSTTEVLESPGVFPNIHHGNMHEIVNILQGKFDFDVVAANTWVDDNIGIRDGNARKRIMETITNEN